MSITDEAVVARLRTGAPGHDPAPFDGVAVLHRSARRLRRRRASITLGVGAVTVVGALLVVGPIPLPGDRVMVMPGSTQVRGAIAQVAPIPELSLDRPSAADMTRERTAADVARLESDVLPLVEDLGVTYWDDQLACTLLEYQRGAFASGAWYCRASEGRGRAVDATAAADFARVQDAIAATGVPVNQVIARTASTDGWDGISFELSAEPWAWSWAYVYLPEGQPAEGDDGVSVTYTKVADHWWFQQFPD